MATTKGVLVVFEDTKWLDSNQTIEGVETYFEPHNENDDEIQKFVTSINNKCNTIDALFESLKFDFFELSEKHFDNNGKDIAESLKRKFEQVYDNYYWHVHEADTTSKEHPEWCDSYLGLLLSLTESGHQCLVIPQMRKDYFDMVKGENMTDQEIEIEFQGYLAYVREVFDLSEDFR